MTGVETEESNLVAHARRELALAGLFDHDSDYAGMLGPAVLKLVEAFAGEGHSGHSAMITLDLFSRLARFENLTPLTNDPDEWIDHTDISSGEPTFQSKRNSEAFSNDGGKTYYILSESFTPDGERIYHTSITKD